ncbi:uncharacterized protein AMSG_04783 [Thecamonas trahens ATCC 50062]|uniref:Uncharacterized protein n=1 Tax=Thecamonas trahens ATCC 50062 TaxID=461836 RepID=A0A0L0DAK9_THETB|nr:hypothetical protein AMSG_04783 [Thecamonas trahens ATCC 50062]KNC48333.1 hypothetical protein AMSG_04783 [Thecamonas trahens ATCC 50062]|eukprot:XP_013758458.1 hypothetical protein AMSG_04783 [Thecamonas trahens ATCC 50062]
MLVAASAAAADALALAVAAVADCPAWTAAAADLVAAHELLPAPGSLPQPCGYPRAAVPVAIIPGAPSWLALAGFDLAAALPLVRLSAVTWAKQQRKHPDIGPRLWAFLPHILDSSMVVHEGRNGYTRHLLFLPRLPLDRPGGRHPWERFKVVVKATLAGDRLYLPSFHRLDNDELPVIAAAGIILRHGPHHHFYSSYELC